MSTLEAMILGLLQGLTEFLPISSSGHLVLVEHMMELDVKEYLFFDILLHLATLLSVCIYFRIRLVALFQSGIAKLSGEENSSQIQHDWQMIWGVVLSTAVTIVFGLLIKFTETMDFMRENLLFVGICFLFTAALLLSTRFRPPSESSHLQSWPVPIVLFALLMGIAQSIAILPGVSRSGMTVCTALLLGSSKQQAVEYSFIMSIPAILAAMAFESLSATWNVSFTASFVGFVASLISGILFLWVLVWIVNKGKLYHFSVYLIPLGIWVIWSSL